MLDNTEKTLDLIAAMRFAVPFEVELMPPLLARLRSEAGGGEIEPRGIVREVSHAGDEGGILLHIDSERPQRRLVASLTHVAVRRTQPFGAAALAYQKHRIKKLKRQSQF